FFFFFQAEDGIRDFHVTGVQTCALPIFGRGPGELVLEHGIAIGTGAYVLRLRVDRLRVGLRPRPGRLRRRGHALRQAWELGIERDRKSTRLNSSHVKISYAVFCLKKKKL